MKERLDRALSRVAVVSALATLLVALMVSAAHRGDVLAFALGCCWIALLAADTIRRRMKE